MMNTRMELNMEELEMVTGGWTFDMLTQEELDVYNELQETWEEMEMNQDWTHQKYIETMINAFIDAMDEKYGV